MAKKSIAMLLAGGQGSRLKDLTRNLAKPAVAFGGKYRIIDFPLSNCTNSGIDTVGVLTQYQPLVLNAYIGNGSPWDLDRTNGGVAVLPPYSEASGFKWYKGTASAIYENMNYIERYDPEYVVILSGDHIYKMNYAKMLDFHVKKGADVSIAVIEVPWDEASRFGIMNTDDDFNIVEFDEKPEEPKSNLASMGIYIFKTDVLTEFLEMDCRNAESSNDFGKDVIPLLLDEKKKLVAYPFSGYWKDVGTIQSLWEANMDLLKPKEDATTNIDLYEENWRIYSKNPSYPAQYIDAEAKVENALVNEGCVVKGTIKGSILFQGVSVGSGSVITDSVIMNNAVIGKNVKINRAIVGPGTSVLDGRVIQPGEHDDGVVLYTGE
ncbi:MAG: glucose-1-phosphate adenylyltransferase [Defluviitaleaceae bacterium]|nr:glucose-1-phosphate adenylyltransferase [Defluviitaleaceae bacterium]